jgi:nucleotide-binding universal stress UspA family protein
MKNIKKIVVPIDFSEYSPQILEYASGVATRNLAEIVAVNVLDKRQIENVTTVLNYGSNIFSVEKYLDDETRWRRNQLDDLVSRWVSEQVPTKTRIISGAPFEEILKVLDDEKADLLIINSKGRTDFQDYMYGTTSEKIFRHSPVSVLSLNLRKWG